jgi:hypothetical protein
MTKILRRDFLKAFGLGAAVAAVDVLVPGCSSHLEKIAEHEVYQPIPVDSGKTTTKPQVTFYTVRIKDSYFSDEVYALARDFLREEVGINVDFRFCRKDEVPKDLDHRTKFMIEEKTGERYVSDRLRQLPKRLSDKDYWERKFNNGGGHFAPEDSKIILKATSGPNGRYSLDIIKSQIKVQKDNLREWESEIRKVRASDDIPEYAKRHRIKSWEELIKNTKPLIKSLERDIIRTAAFTLLHEIGHFALWHTHLWENDGIEDYVDGAPNVMSYERPIPKGKYGFALQPEQIDRMKDYFAGGETFKRFQRHRFNDLDLLSEIEEENDYVMTREAAEIQRQKIREVKKLIEE